MNRPMTPPEKIMGEARWKPTAEAINALPDGLRHYIHDLESRADPAGDCARATLAEDARDRLASILTSQRAENRQLRIERDNAREMEDVHGDNWEAAQAEVERLRGELRVGNCHDHIGSAVTELDLVLEQRENGEEIGWGALEQLAAVLSAAYSEHYNETGDQPDVRANRPDTKATAPTITILDGDGCQGCECESYHGGRSCSACKRRHPECANDYYQGLR